MKWLLAIVVWGVPSYILFEMIRGYTATQGTQWERLKAAFQGSLTIFWSRLNSLSALLTAGLVWVAPMMNDPSFSAHAATFLSPEALLVYMGLSMFAAELARRRTLE